MNINNNVVYGEQNTQNRRNVDYIRRQSSPRSTRIQHDTYNQRELTPNQRKRLAERKKREEKAAFRRTIAGAAAVVTLIGGVVGGWISNAFNSKADAIPLPDDAYVDTFAPSEQPIETTFEYETASPETQAPETQAPEQTTISPEAQAQLDELNSALNRFSEQLGEDGLSLIKERVDLLGNGRVNVSDVVKILWMESRGRIYDPNNPGQILPSYTGQAFGPFQVTPDTQDYINYYYHLEGDEALDLMDPYDNLDICILDLRFLRYEREKDLANGVTLPTGDRVEDAIMWGYHDGAWANSVTTHGQDYIDQYNSFNLIDDSYFS